MHAARTRLCRCTCAWYRTMSEGLTQFEPQRCPRRLPWLAGLSGCAPALPRNPTGDARWASRCCFSSRMKVLSAIFGRPLSLRSMQTGLDMSLATSDEGQKGEYMAGAGAWRGLCPRGPIHSFNYHSRLEKKNLGGMDTWLCDLFTYLIPNHVTLLLHFGLVPEDTPISRIYPG